MNRVEGIAKVTGQARYAGEAGADDALYAFAVQSAVASGTVTGVEDSTARNMPGVMIIMSCLDPPRMADTSNAELALFQSREIHYRGQLVGAVIADTLENARAAAAAVRVDYEPAPHDVELRADHPRLYRPETVNPGLPAEVSHGDLAAGLAGAAVRVDVTYRTPAEHNNPMEPHAALASWDDDGQLTVFGSTQGPSAERDTLAAVLGLRPGQVRVISPHVGGGFGSKGTTRPNAVLAALAARATGRPVKAVLTRQQMFQVSGYRTPTIQRLRLGAEPDGKLVAVGHEVVEQTAIRTEFAEQTATCTGVMYATPALLATHRLVRLNVPVPSWMRAPGECPGMYALESAMDELAAAAGIDPVELRIRNEPETEPASGLPFSSRHLVDCLREGARRFGWADRDPRPGMRRSGAWLTGTGVAASTYPARRRPSSASVTAEGDDVVVRIAAADIGTGARTALTQIAADRLDLPAERVRVELGDSSLPTASLAGGSMGTASWGSAVTLACADFKKNGGGTGAADTSREVAADSADFARHGFGAQFAEVLVNTGTGEVRVPRLLGVFAVGRVIDPTLAKSQFVGGMTMGLGMALLEESFTDAACGGFLRRDLAQYHVPVCADVQDIDAFWLAEEDPHLNPMGSKGIGEIGIVGTAAAIGNAVWHATGQRVRELPITPSAVVTACAAAALAGTRTRARRTCKRRTR